MTRASAPGAVCFDMWETLVPMTRSMKAEALDRTASLVGGDEVQFRRVWSATREDRETRSLYAYLRGLEERLAVTMSRSLCDEVEQVRLAVHGRGFESMDTNVVASLRKLRAGGTRLGLVSNCSSEVRKLIMRSALGDLFDVVVLSAEFGQMKPSQAIFRQALRSLGVRAEDTLYVGDGSDGELAAARALGCMAAQFCVEPERAEIAGFPRLESLERLSSAPCS